MGKNVGLCVVPGCLNVYYAGCSTRFHRFPKDIKRKKNWLRCLNLSLKGDYLGERVCHLHFDFTDYVNNKPDTHPLKRTALPSMLTNNVKRYSNHNSDAKSIDTENILKNLSGSPSSTNIDDSSDFKDVDLVNDSILTSDDGKVAKKRKLECQKKPKKVIPKPNVAKKKSNISQELDTFNIKQEIVEEEKQESISEIIEEVVVENVLTHVCRTCLATGCKMFSMKQYNLDRAYLMGLMFAGSNLTDLQFYAEEMPQMVCFECVKRFVNFREFSMRCITAAQLLIGLIEDNQLTMENIKNIDRKTEQLESKLVSMHNQSNNFNILLEEVKYESKDISQVHFDHDYILLGTDGVNIQDENNHDIVYKDVDFIEENKNIFTEDFDGLEHDDDIIATEDVELLDENKHKNKDSKAPNNRVKNNATEKPMDIYLNKVSKEVDEINFGQVSKLGETSDNRRELDEESDRWEEEEEYIFPPITHTTKNENNKIPNLNEYSTVGMKSAKVLIKEEFKKMFIHKVLTYEDQKKELENRKTGREYINSNLKCDLCYRGFQKEKPFNAHLKKHTNECGELICDICKVHFPSRRKISNHIKTSHWLSYSCRECNFVTTYRSTAYLHKNSHDGFRFRCQLCQNNYSKLPPYLQHLRRYHPEDAVCHICGLSFALVRDLDRHFLYKHRKENLFLLPATESSRYGPLLRSQAADLVAARYSTTLPEDAPNCPLCDIRFLDEGALSVHLSRSPNHGNDPVWKPKERKRGPNKNTNTPGNNSETLEPRTCELCDEEFPTFLAYKRHIAYQHPFELLQNSSHHPRGEHMCDICGKIFQNANYFKDHRQSHDGSTYPCDKCDRKFSTKLQLNMHKLNHTHSRQCKVCGKKFTDLSNLSRHMKIHTHKPYSCNTCNKRFPTPSEKKNHIRHTHMGIPWPKKRPKGEARKRRLRCNSSLSDNGVDQRKSTVKD